MNEEFEYDMDYEKDIYFPEIKPVEIGRWYILTEEGTGIDGPSMHWTNHNGHFVKVIGYRLPLKTDHHGLALVWCKQCKKAIRSINVQFLHEINKPKELKR